MCPNCTTATTNNSLCKTCRRSYLKLMQRITPTLHNLRQVAERKVRIGDPQHGCSRAFAPSPIDWTAQDCIDGIIDWMKGTLGSINPTYLTMPATQWHRMRNALYTHRNDILAMRNAAEFMQDLNRRLDKAERLMTPHENTIIIGTCPTCDTCAQTTPDANTWTCPQCRETYRTSDLKTYATAQLHKLEYTGTPTACSRYMAERFGIHINPSKIRTWLTRGTLTQTTPAGRNTYRFNLGELAEKANT